MTLLYYTSILLHNLINPYKTGIVLRTIYIVQYKNSYIKFDF